MNRMTVLLSTNHFHNYIKHDFCPLHVIMNRVSKLERTKKVILDLPHDSLLHTATPRKKDPINSLRVYPNAKPSKLLRSSDNFEKVP
mmetsp:Transcript_16980/g.30754  ORF Transcript_16980/g.30754 Transcript_16980/m.30754 type:complete len:87 (+) Transcript_16980:748-1008(+)